MTEQNPTLASFVTELYAKLLRSSHDVTQAPSLATGCEPEGSPATGARRQKSLAKSKPKNTTKILYVRSQRAAPSLIWSQEAVFFFFLFFFGGGDPDMVYSTVKCKPLKIESWDKVYFTLFQIRNADHEMLGTSSQAQEHTEKFSPTPLCLKKKWIPTTIRTIC